MEGLISYLESKGAEDVLGRDPDSRIQGLEHDRALCTSEGIYGSDVILVPIEDGDRAEAKKVISIDLNPLSRTSKAATVPVCDEISRAIENISRFVEELRGDRETIIKTLDDFSNQENRRRTVEGICRFLMDGLDGGDD